MDWLSLGSYLVFILYIDSLQLVAGFALGEMPSQTLGYGEVLQMPSPTLAPELELVRRRLDWGFGVAKEKNKRGATNVCTEWTIPGGFGQPQCPNSETCLFTSASDGYFYEGCGKTSVSYDWITECWDWPQTQVGDAPSSQIYCLDQQIRRELSMFGYDLRIKRSFIVGVGRQPGLLKILFAILDHEANRKHSDSSAPACGYLAFVFGPGATYSNFGCATTSYELTVELLETAATLATLDESVAGGNAGGVGTETVTAGESVIPTANSNPSTTSPSDSRPKTTSQIVAPQQTSSSSSSSSTSTIGSHKKKKIPIGPIIGGVVGGIALLALIFLLAFFLLKKKNRYPSVAPHSQSAYQTTQDINGNGNGNATQNDKPTAGVYIPSMPIITEKENPQVQIPTAQNPAREQKLPQVIHEVYRPPPSAMIPSLQSQQYASRQNRQQ
ncbi:hypothetical protein NHQ30_005514 [Ciborinia camelliae]|nr:hypothetical protein NHQ30_005514 [Ciborinia camelliae]